ncbi:MAG TPA: thiol-disulfide oxidoreductase DCC family protein [Puia sp.]|jgi:predicted DCC family thiol-disulfide oxidoreductase YuxK|nr:thiol-disulfide oxidoreductase DCC family protein [Puia sp.]
MNEPGADLILFDGVCNLCNRLVRFIIKRDPSARFKFASLQSDIGYQWLNRFGLTNNAPDSVVLIKDEKYYLKSTGVLKILRDLGSVWKVFYIFMIVPRPVRDFVYDMIAKSRYRIFGKRDTCMIPTPDLKDRFL